MFNSKIKESQDLIVKILLNLNEKIEALESKLFPAKEKLKTNLKDKKCKKS